MSYHLVTAVNCYDFSNYDEYVKEFNKAVPPDSGMNADAFILEALEDEEIEKMEEHMEINRKLETEGLSLFFEFSIDKDESEESLLLRFIGVETFN